MKKTFGLFIFWILSTSVSFSQKLQYGGMQQAGIVVSEGETKINFTLTNGVRLSRFFVGLGANVLLSRNFTNYWSTPFNTSGIYLDGRYYINKKKNFFGKLNGGVNLITQKLQSSAYHTYTKHPGYYGAVGLGFKARLANEVFYSFDINYCMRQTRYDYNTKNYSTMQWSAEKYDFRQSVLIITLGIEIF